MNTWPIMQRAATGFADRLRRATEASEHGVPAFGSASDELIWTNTLLASPRFRHGHVETFVVPGRLSVLHVCLFPHLDDPGPIFGFDMIAGPARVTGIFLDLSPTTAPSPGPRLGDVRAANEVSGFLHPRELPDWGSIFSADCLAIRPADLDEVEAAIGIAQAALEACLAVTCDRSADRAAEIGAGQARYIAAQRRNEHTFRMLSGFIGPEKAREFIDEVLFPAVPSRAI